MHVAYRGRLAQRVAAGGDEQDHQTFASHGHGAKSFGGAGQRPPLGRTRVCGTRAFSSFPLVVRVGGHFISLFRPHERDWARMAMSDAIQPQNVIVAETAETELTQGAPPSCFQLVGAADLSILRNDAAVKAAWLEQKRKENHMSQERRRMALAQERGAFDCKPAIASDDELAAEQKRQWLARKRQESLEALLRRRSLSIEALERPLDPSSAVAEMFATHDCRNAWLACEVALTRQHPSIVHEHCWIDKIEPAEVNAPLALPSVGAIVPPRPCEYSTGNRQGKLHVKP